jgi:hypothetical protein
LKVSWQVTGIRQDPYALKYPLRVEEEKPAAEQGYYLHPDAYGQPPEKSTEWARNHHGKREGADGHGDLAEDGARVMNKGTSRETEQQN